MDCFDSLVISNSSTNPVISTFLTLLSSMQSLQQSKSQVLLSFLPSLLKSWEREGEKQQNYSNYVFGFFYPTCAHFIVMVRAFFAESDTRISSKNSSLLIVQRVKYCFSAKCFFHVSPGNISMWCHHC